MAIPQIITTDALELMVQQAAITKELLKAVQMLREDIAAMNTMEKQPVGLNEFQAAEYIGLSVYTLRASRKDGKLGSRPAPGWKKAGSRVIYEYEELDRWLREDAKGNRGGYESDQAAELRREKMRMSKGRRAGDGVLGSVVHCSSNSAHSVSS